MRFIKIYRSRCLQYCREIWWCH